MAVIRDKNTNESKGLAFVTYNTASDAASAFENCETGRYTTPINKFYTCIFIYKFLLYIIVDM